MDQFIQTIVREAGEAILPLYKNGCEKKSKTHEHDVVTEADMLSNQILLTGIRETYPDHGIISEEVPEGDWETDKEYTWVLDPLDGTKPFSIGWPMFAVMAALQKGGEIIMGAMYFPVTDELLFAHKGKGAFLNDCQVHTSTRREIKGSFGSFTTSYRSWPSPQDQERRAKFVVNLLNDREIFGNNVWCICMAVKSLAEGKIDWLNVGGKFWDWAPAKVILEEAGCVVTDGEGGPLLQEVEQGIMAASPTLHPQLCDLLGVRTS